MGRALRDVPARTRTRRGCMGCSNVLVQNSGATLEYEVRLDDLGRTSRFFISPSLSVSLPTGDIYPERGLRLGVQIDDQPMQVIDACRGLVDTFPEYTPQNLARSKVLKPPPSVVVLRSAVSGMEGLLIPAATRCLIMHAGLTPPPCYFWQTHIVPTAIDPEIVVEQIVVNPDNNRYSYFGNSAINTYK